MLLPLVCPCLQDNMRGNLLCKEIVCNFYKIKCAKTILFEKYSFCNNFGRNGTYKGHSEKVLKVVHFRDFQGVFRVFSGYFQGVFRVFQDPSKQLI